MKVPFAEIITNRKYLLRSLVVVLALAMVAGFILGIPESKVLPARAHSEAAVSYQAEVCSLATTGRLVLPDMCFVHYRDNKTGAEYLFYARHELAGIIRLTNAPVATNNMEVR